MITMMIIFMTNDHLCLSMSYFIVSTYQVDLPAIIFDDYTRQIIILISNLELTIFKYLTTKIQLPLSMTGLIFNCVEKYFSF